MGIAFLFILSLSGQANAQVSLKNAVFAELGGNGYYYSVNYERSFPKGILARVGIGGAAKNLFIPLLAGKCFGKGNNQIELTAGAVCIFGSISSQDNSQDALDPRSQIFATAFIGYRFQKPGGKFQFRAGYTPFYKIHDSYAEFNNHLFYQWGGLSFGYRF